MPAVLQSRIAQQGEALSPARGWFPRHTELVALQGLALAGRGRELAACRRPQIWPARLSPAAWRPAAFQEYEGNPAGVQGMWQNVLC